MKKIDLSDNSALIPFALFAVFAALVAYAIIKGNKRVPTPVSTGLTV
jgi:hypothetical protein